MTGYIDWRGFKVYPDNVPMQRPGLYQFARIETGESYAGVTGLSIASRCWYSSKGHSGDKFNNAIEEYGADAFLLMPLLYVIDPEADNRQWLLQIEADWIAENDAVKNGYNTQEASGSIGPFGEEFSQLVKEAMARPEVWDAFMAAVVRRWEDPAEREAARLRWEDEEIRNKRVAGMLAAWADPVVKAARVASANRPEITIKRVAGAKRGRAKSLADPAKEERRITALRIALANPDVQARRGASYSATCKVNPKTWITDGVKSRTINASDFLPEGWAYGKTVPKGLKFWINDGTKELKLNRIDPIPDGWRAGRAPRRRKE